MKSTTAALYTERQYFRQPWLWVLFMMVNAAYIFGVINMLNTTDEASQLTTGGILMSSIIVFSNTVLFFNKCAMKPLLKRMVFITSFFLSCKKEAGYLG